MDYSHTHDHTLELSASPAEMAEEQLVVELRAGRVEAFNYLIAVYHRPLYNLVCRVLGEPSDAADIIQEIFLKVFRAASRFEGKSSLKTWLYRIALHEVSNHRRWWRRHKQQEMSLDDGEFGGIAAQVPDHGRSPLQQALQAEARERVLGALAEVPEPYRTAILLRELEDFSYDEIAHILQVRIGTVKSRLLRGREMLRQKLMADGELGRELRASVVEAL